MTLNPDCPYCAEFIRRGTTEPLLAVEYQMLLHNFYVRKIVEMCGFDRAAEIAKEGDAWVSEELRKLRQ